MRIISRTTFLHFLLKLFGLIGFARLSILCSDKTGGNNTSGGSQAECLQAGTLISIENNHNPGPHVLIIPISDIVTGTDKTYNITGSADHSHQVTVTAAEFSNLAANIGINEISTTGAGTKTYSHTHSIQVSCASN